MDYTPDPLTNDPEVYPPVYKSALYNDLWSLSNLNRVRMPGPRSELLGISFDGPGCNDTALAGWVGSTNARWVDFCSAFERAQFYIEINGLMLQATLEASFVTPKRSVCPLRDPIIREYAKDMPGEAQSKGASSLEPNPTKLCSLEGVTKNATGSGGSFIKASQTTRSFSDTMNLSVPDHPAPTEAHNAQPTNSRNCNNTSAASNQDAAEREDSKIIINNIDTASVITHPRHRHDPDLDSIAYQVRSPEHQKPVDHLGPNDRSSLYPCRPVHKSQPQPPSQLVIATEILAQSSTAVRPTEEYERLPASFLAVRPSPQKFWGLPGPGPIHFASSHDADPYGSLRFGRTSSAGEASSDGNHLSNPAGEIRADRGLGMGSDSVLLQNLDAAYVHYAGQFGWPPEASAAGTAYGGASALPYWQPCIYPVPPPPIYTPALRERGYYIGRFDQYSDVRSPGTSGNQARLLAPTATIARYGNVAPRSSAPGPTATSSRDYQTNADSSLPGQENHTLNAFNRAIPRLSLPTQPTRTPAAQDLSQDRAPYAEPPLRNQFPAFSPNLHPDAHTELGSMVRHSGYDERFPTTHVGRSANVPNVASTPDYQVYEPRPNSGYNITSSRANSGVTSEQRRAKHRHQCDMCEKSYPKPYQLRDHKVKHTGGPKPYPCGFGRCSAAFTTRSNMRKHFNRENCSGGSSQIVLESTSKPARLETVEETAVAGPSARVPVFGADDQHSGQFVSRSDDATIKKYARFRRRG